jgi:hypothetical protein
MAKANPIFSSFNGGELAPSLEGRVDLGKYGSGCKIIENFVPMVQGPAKRRSGTRFVKEVKNSANRCWLIRFEFSEDQAFILEFGNQYIRFYTNHGQLQTGTVPNWATSTQYDKGDLVVQSGNRYYCQRDHLSGTFATDLSNGAWYALTGTIYEIPSPYTSADMTNPNGTIRLRMVQSADVLYITHPNYPPQKLARFGNTRWVMSPVEFLNGPFEDIDPENTISVFSSTSNGSTTIKSSSPIFSASDVGTLFFIENKDAGGIKPWESQKGFDVNQNPFGERRRSDGKIYFCTTNTAPPSSQRYYTGSTRPTHTRGRFVDGFGQITGTSADGPIGVEWEYESLDYGTVKITGYVSPTEVTGFVVKKLPFNVVLTTIGGSQSISAMAESPGGDTRITVSGHGIALNKSLQVTLNYRSGSAFLSRARSISGTFFGTIIDANTIDINFRFPEDFTSFTDGTIQEVSAGQATPRWAFSRWSPTRGWPNQVAFFRERLVFATDQTIDMSVAADFENFSDKNDEGEVASDMAISLTISSDQVNVIEWMAPADGLIIGTTGGEFVISEITKDEVLGPGNVKSVIQTVFGSRSVIPVLVADMVVFVQRAGRKLRELKYDFGTDGYISVDLTVLSEHITNGGITDIVYQQEPHSIIWCVRADGTLLGFTYNKEQEVIGWHRHKLGGDGIVECLETIPRPDGSQDDLWMIVRRTINGQTKRYIEYLEPDFTENSTIADAFFVDSGLTYTGTAATTISGLGHLEGKTVQVLTNGAAHPDRVVESGSITLQLPATKVQVGLGYKSTLKTMRIEAGGEAGTAQGKTKRIQDITIRFLATLGAKAGPDENTLDEIQFRRGSDPMDAPPPVFTGDKEIEWPNGYDTDGYVTIVQEQPLPMTIVAIMPELHTQD